MNIINKYIIPLRKFLVLWLGQSISMLGSSMTGFPITIWAYEKTGSALVLSISGLLIMALSKCSINLHGITFKRYCLMLCITDNVY